MKKVHASREGGSQRLKERKRMHRVRELKRAKRKNNEIKSYVRIEQDKETRTKRNFQLSVDE
ncbi:uncharacterized protein SCHCODRAFT_01250820 [Schizophyllum commune H4-8]|uniref:uncharacterized protein n=1 Tax=Schizophyllum commune (strain H4-8 / FGSC 9210) TaxID=578458 RepID=UPI00215E8A3D|nr:uncharacterized protein SCHCODRAFT_01250820 [Schizophyllum commune H4-8]KAI5898606.1 hypothetical protein SCHCODRAFT_01250820 [Schizophyllum commune H4-8]